MFSPLKKVFFAITFNLSLFLILFVGIQNSVKMRKVNLIISETINLPVGFIIGISFITGSITGTSLTATLLKNRE